MAEYPSKSDLNLRDEWQVSQGTYNKRPLVLRLRSGASEIVGHPEFRHQVGIAVAFKKPDRKGLPQREDEEVLYRFEDELAALEEANKSLLVGVITTGGMREFVLYTSDPETVKGQFSTLKDAAPGYRVQLMIKPDPAWETFKQLTG
jgi:uncharacterized protein DUF695